MNQTTPQAIRLAVISLDAPSEHALYYRQHRVQKIFEHSDSSDNDGDYQGSPWYMAHSTPAQIYLLYTTYTTTVASVISNWLHAGGYRGKSNNMDMPLTLMIPIKLVKYYCLRASPRVLDNEQNHTILRTSANIFKEFWNNVHNNKYGNPRVRLM